MTEHSDDTWVEVYRAYSRTDAEQHALVVVAAGIDCHVVDNYGSLALLVRAANQARARSELDLYIRDNTPAPPPSLLPRSRWEMAAGTIIYCCVLLFIHGAVSRQVFSADLLSAGHASAGQIVDGQWWRALTALSLHLDGPHLLANLVVGGFLGVLLSRLLGGGLAWLLILLAGGLGNGLSAMVHPPAHMAIGASTAVFAALGIISVLMTKYRESAWTGGARRWVPVAAGVMLLAFLGIQGERIDIGGHIAGFVAGCLMGVCALAIGEASVRQIGRSQLAYAAIAISLFAVSWRIALDGVAS